jgi:hypothetical protein
MNKNEVVSLMNDVVNHINEQIGKSQNLTDDQIREALKLHQESLSHVNSILYDELDKRGLIAHS